ncbi:MAG: hypothetical protein ACREPJ_16095, partial [Rhodanobacteraceae bacterium]
MTRLRAVAEASSAKNAKDAKLEQEAGRLYSLLLFARFASFADEVPLSCRDGLMRGGTAAEASSAKNAKDAKLEQEAGRLYSFSLLRAS